MFRMYGDYKFKLEKDYYENDKNGNYFIVTKIKDYHIYQIVVYNKKGVLLLEKNIAVEDDDDLEKEIANIIDKFENVLNNK